MIRRETKKENNNIKPVFRKSFHNKLVEKVVTPTQ